MLLYERWPSTSLGLLQVVLSALVLALTGFPGFVSRLYAADLAGAALGCLLLIVVIDWSDGPTAVLWVAEKGIERATAAAAKASFGGGTRVGNG